MPIFSKIRAKIFAASLVLPVLLFAAACSDSNVANSNSSNQIVNDGSENRAAVSDDLAALSALVKLPAVPATNPETADEPETRDREEVVWHETETADPKQRKLIAVLKYSPEITAKIIESAEKHQPAAPADVDAEDWFPPELVAKSQETGDASLKGVAYAANDFLQPPYTSGRLTRINDTDYFVLEMFSS